VSFRPSVPRLQMASRKPIDHRELTIASQLPEECRPIAQNHVTIRDIVSAPIIVAAATNARRLARSGRVLPNCEAMICTNFRKPCVAAARVLSSPRAISLPSAATGQPSAGSSLCAAERYFSTIAFNAR